MFFNEILKTVEHLDLLFMLHTIFARTIVAKNCEGENIFEIIKHMKLQNKYVHK